MTYAIVGFLVGLLLGILVDVRARKERDERIRELERRVEDLTASAPVRVCDSSLRGCRAGG